MSSRDGGTEPGVFSGDFWIETADRAVKTAGGALLSAWGADWTGFYALGWDTTWRMALALTVFSVVGSIVSAPIGRRASASLLARRR